jgi:hypothetical protein
MEFSMRNHISYTVLGVALLAGASAANAQTVIMQPTVAVPPRAVVAQSAATVETVPVETVETVQTVRSAVPAHRTSHRIVRSRPASVVTTTTRTITRERVIPTQTVFAPVPAVTPLARPTYNDVVEAPAAYPPRLYDVATPSAVIAEPGAPFVGEPFGVAAPVPAYRYVYEPDRILVIDAATGIAMQAIPR